MVLTIAGYKENISKNSVKWKCINWVKSGLFSKAGLRFKKSKFHIIIEFFWKYSKLSIWSVSDHKTKQKLLEMIFHFLLKNDLFNRRGQKMVPIHFYNYIYWDTFLTKFYTFCSHCTIDPFFHTILLHYSIVSYSILFFRKIPRKKPLNFSSLETVIRRRFFLWIFS